MLKYVFAALLFLAAPASALTYTYQGQDFTCAFTTDPFCKDYEGQAGFTGELVINERLLPGPLANSELYLYMESEVAELHDLVSGYRLTTTEGFFTGEVRNTTFEYVKPVFITSMTGHLAREFVNVGVCCTNWITLEFDASKQIVAWEGSAWQGGSNDPYTETNGDGFASGAQSLGPGTWTLTGIATVPLPGAGWLLVAGLLGLWRVRSKAP